MAGSGNRDLAKEAFWRDAFLKFAVSGQSRKDFCAENGLKLDNFTYWKTAITKRDAEAKRAKREAKSENSAKAFVEVNNLPVLKSDVLEPEIFEPDYPRLEMPVLPKLAAQVVFAGCTLYLFDNVRPAMLKTVFQALRESDR